MANKKLITKKGSARQSAKRVILIGLLLLSAVLAWKVYDHHQQVNKEFAIEKVQYAAVDKQMTSVMNGIEQTVGKPYEIHKGYGCGYVHLKYSRGPQTCSIYYNFTYEVSSIADGNKQAISMLPVLKNSVTSGNLITFPVSVSRVQNDGFGASYDVSHVGTCDFDYKPVRSEIHNQLLTHNFEKKIVAHYAAEYSLSCGGNVIKSLY